MTSIGIAMPGLSIAEARLAAQAASEYSFDSFSVYGDLGELPPYAMLHSVADELRRSNISHIGPMGLAAGLYNPEIVAGDAAAFEEKMPGKTYLGIVRGAFLEKINQRPASLDYVDDFVRQTRNKLQQRGIDVPIYLGGFGPRILALAGRIDAAAVKLGGTANPELARIAAFRVNNPETRITLGSVSVIDVDRKAARSLARREVAKYLHVVGHLDPTLDADEKQSLAAFSLRYRQGDRLASDDISESLLDKFALAGTPEDALAALGRMDGHVDRFEFGTPHGLTDRPTAVRYIGESIVKTRGVSL